MKRISALCCELLLAFISLTSTSRAQFTSTSGLEDEKFSSRPSPAQSTKESAATLKEKGYATIGEITIGDEGKRCWSANCAASLDCNVDLGKKDFTAKLLEEAASKGGDLVILSSDNTISKTGISKKGKCISKISRQKTVPTMRCQSGSRNSATGSYDPGPCTWENKTRTVKECVNWETIPGYGCSANSKGTVLRLEPGLDKRIAAKIAERLAREAASFRESLEKNTSKYEEISFRLSMNAFMAETRRDHDAPTLAYEDGKWGYRDRNGKMIIPPRYNYANPFSEGLAVVLALGKYMIIDKTGNIVATTKFQIDKDTVRNPSVQDLSEGFAAAGIGSMLTKKWGYIDTKGELAIPIQFDEVRPFAEGLAAAAVGGQFDPNRWGYIDKTGKYVIPRSYYSAGEFSEELAPVRIGNIGSSKWGYINKDGVVVIQPVFDDARPFSEGLAAVAYGTHSDDTKWGYINKDGQMVIQPAFSEPDSFSEGLARVNVAGKWGYIDKKGNMVIKPQFFRASTFVNNEARVLIDDSVAYIDKSGQITAQAK